MARVRAHDIAAFETLYDTYYRLAYGIALRILGDPSGAEDVTQAVFLKIWTSPESFGGGNFVAWLARVARNRSLDILRAKAVRNNAEQPGEIPPDNPVDNLVLAELDGQMVRGALDRLATEQRVLIELAFFGGLTHDEIARRTSLPLGTVKTRIRSGLRHLRNELEAVTS